jgi:hypothetical protein
MIRLDRSAVTPSNPDVRNVTHRSVTDHRGIDIVAEPPNSVPASSGDDSTRSLG